MNTNIPITVRERVPTVPEEYSVISHNTDYTVTFDFDSDWTAKYKTVYFVAESGEYTPVVMEGDTCAVPEVKGDCRYLFIGVQEGTAEKPGVLKTSLACCLKIRDSITDMIGAPIADPAPSVYEQIIAMLEKITAPTWSDVKNKPFSALGDGLSVDEAGVLSAQGGSGGTPNAVQYVEQSLTDEQKAQARTNIGAGTSSFSGSYNDLTNKPSGGDNSLGIATATVGQIAKVTAVDSTGKPTAWAAVDLPSGGGSTDDMELIHIGTTGASGIALYSIDKDMSGNEFALSEFRLKFTFGNETGNVFFKQFAFNGLGKENFATNGNAHQADSYNFAGGNANNIDLSKGVEYLAIYEGKVYGGVLVMRGWVSGYGYDADGNMLSLSGGSGRFNIGTWNDIVSKGTLFPEGIKSFAPAWNYSSCQNATFELYGKRV